MTEPTTEAGRALLDLVATEGLPLWQHAVVADRILAIEREARATAEAERGRLRELDEAVGAYLEDVSDNQRFLRMAQAYVALEATPSADSVTVRVEDVARRLHDECKQWDAPIEHMDNAHFIEARRLLGIEALASSGSES